MAVAGQSIVSAGRSRSSRRRPRAAWPTQSELIALSPVVRLLSSIWTLPQIRKVGVIADDRQVDLWVIMDEEDLDVERELSVLERQYRNDGVPAGCAFALHVVPLNRVESDLIPIFEPILER